MRDQIKTVLFHNSFHLKGLDGEQPAGTYDVVTTEELIPSLWFEAWRRTETQIRIPSRGAEFRPDPVRDHPAAGAGRRIAV